MIEFWFPVPIYKEKIEGQKNKEMADRAQLIKKMTNKKTTWNCETYNCLGVRNLIHDDVYVDCITVCTEHVAKFAVEYGITNPRVDCLEAWINIAKTNNYQEFHIHPAFHFSAVYYLKTSKNCGNIVLSNPHAHSNMYLPRVDNYNMMSFTSVTYEPEEGLLLIFPSYMHHMVLPNKSKSDRISLAMNFVINNPVGETK